MKNVKHMKHGLIMLLGCLLPILLIAILPQFGIGTGKLGSLAFLICPLMHIGMMFFMNESGEQSCHGSSKAVQASQE